MAAFKRIPLQTIPQTASFPERRQGIYGTACHTTNQGIGTFLPGYNRYKCIPKDAITNQLGEDVTVVTEPSRRDTFPAICLASAYLEKTAKCDKNETVIVMPCDPYTEERYFQTIAEMAEAVQNNVADLVLMGIKPTYPSAKYGYVIPQSIAKQTEYMKWSVLWKSRMSPQLKDLSQMAHFGTAAYSLSVSDI